MGCLLSRSAKQTLTRHRIFNIPPKVKPYLLPLRRLDDVDNIGLKPKAPVIIFFSGPEYNNKSIEKIIREAQDRYAFAAIRCFEEGSPILALFDGVLPCVVLCADWLYRGEIGSFIPLTQDRRANEDYMDGLFKYFIGNELPNWWIKIDNEKQSMDIVMRHEFCLVINVNEPMWYIHQILCLKFCSYEDRFIVVQVKKRPSMFSKSYCIFYREGIVVDRKSDKISFSAFIDIIDGYMNDVLLLVPRAKFRRNKCTSRTMISQNTLFLEFIDDYSQSDRFELQAAAYVNARGPGFISKYVSVH